MKAVATNKLAKINESPEVDYCLFFNGLGNKKHPVEHYLVYEKHRDFLSAPRAFVVLEISCNSRHWFELDADVSEVAFDGDLESGFYQILDGTDTALNYCMLAKDVCLAFSCQHMNEIKTLYHCQNSRDALATFLQTLTH